MLAGHELLPLALERGHGFGLQHLVPPFTEAVRQLALVDGRRELRGRASRPSSFATNLRHRRDINIHKGRLEARADAELAPLSSKMSKGLRALP